MQEIKIFSVIGLQWGDEGKGKIVDYLAEKTDAVVRFQGGHNAGHTIVVGDKTYKLSILPSSIIRPKIISIIDNGTVIDLQHFIEETKRLTDDGINISSDNLFISDIATIILPIHVMIDNISENLLNANERIGTTGRGIGPAYADKVARRAIRVCDLEYDDLLKSKLERIIAFYAPILEKNNLLNQVNVEKSLEFLKSKREHILKYVINTTDLLSNLTKQGKKIMFEGAQGAMLDLNYGTYPYVTSSNTIPAQVYLGSGLAFGKLDYNLGVVKAYSTRVGGGPFPTEDNNEVGSFLQKAGDEVGTVTGRIRRCGFFDAVLIKNLVKNMGINGIILTKIDVLSGLKSIKVCTKYKYEGKYYDYLPNSQIIQSKLEPIYEELPGWEFVTGTKDYNHLANNLKQYIKYIEDICQVKVVMISVGKKRDEIIKLKDFPLHI